MVEFFNDFIHPKSPTRAKLSIHLVAQTKGDITTTQISDLVADLDLSPDTAVQAAADLQARLTAAHHDETKELESLTRYLRDDLGVDVDKIETAAKSWKEISKHHKASTDAAQIDGSERVAQKATNGTTPVFIKDIRDFRSGLSLTGGPRALTDISEFLDVDAKL